MNRWFFSLLFFAATTMIGPLTHAQTDPLPSKTYSICVPENQPLSSGQSFCLQNCYNLATIVDLQECLNCCVVANFAGSQISGDVNICSKYIQNNFFTLIFQLPPGTQPATPPAIPQPVQPAAPTPQPIVPPKEVVQGVSPSCSCKVAESSGPVTRSDCDVQNLAANVQSLQWNITGQDATFGNPPSSPSALKSMTLPSATGNEISVYTQIQSLASQSRPEANVTATLLAPDGTTVAVVPCGNILDQSGVQGGGKSGGGCSLTPVRSFP